MVTAPNEMDVRIFHTEKSLEDGTDANLADFNSNSFNTDRITLEKERSKSS